MKVNIFGNLSLGSALPEYIENKINHEVLNIFETAVNANVSFTKNGRNNVQAHININEGTKRGLIIKSSAESDDIYNAFDLALVKIISQLRKYKDKLKDYKKRLAIKQQYNNTINTNSNSINNNDHIILADRYILTEDNNINSATSITTNNNSDNKNYNSSSNNNTNTNHNSNNLHIITTKETEIEELSIDEALMKMNLINLPAFMFINKDNGLLNVVYKRPDGNLSWINPKGKVN